MSFTNGSLIVQGIQINLPSLGTIKQGPFSIPFSGQYESVSYPADTTASDITIAAGYKGIMIIPNNSAASAMTLKFSLNGATVEYISPEFVSLITFDPDNYSTEYSLTVSNTDGAQCQVVLF